MNVGVPALAVSGLVVASMALVVASVTLRVSPAAADTNTIANAGFESGMTGWTCGATGSVVGGHAHSGLSSLAGAASDSDNAQCTQAVTVAPNTRYTLSAFVNGAFVYLGVTGTGTGDVSSWTPGTAGAYQQLSTSFTTAAATTRVTVYLHGWYGQGTYYADDVAMPGPGGSTPPPTTPPPTSPPPTTPPPTSPPPTSPPPTAPPPTGNGTLPKHELTGYWQNFNNGAALQRLRDVSSDYDLIAVAFADTDPSRPGGVTFNIDAGLSTALGGYTNADFKADIATLHSRGKKVVVSVGGQNGTVSVGDSTAASNFASSVFGLMQAFGFDGVDIDLENGVNPDVMSSSLHTLRASAGSGLIITMAPETLFVISPSATYLSLAIKIKDILTVMHTQYYNSGSMPGCDGGVYSQGTVDFVTSLACTAIQAGLRPDQVALGFPASARAAGSGFVDPSIVNRALDCLANGTNCGVFKPATTWPTIRGAMTWSTNWDQTAASTWSRSVKGHLNTLP
jgi:chitinase